jgi:hypothetical protein
VREVSKAQMVPVLPVLQMVPVLNPAQVLPLLALARSPELQQALRRVERMLAATYRSPRAPQAVLLRRQGLHQSSLLHQ